ncbi:MAG: isoprenylcysteine carboxylmethyltransferase family protein [Candidatus Vogelbacteria bacterium]|nr:isoprenylcysteine carboxylmethyltransferase family protein [Candidatus Vogelbacteria bacterium]
MNSAHKTIFQTSDFIAYSLILFSLIIEYFRPSSLTINRQVSLALGVILLLVAIIIITKAQIELKRFGQKSRPGQETTKLITTGIFKFSRNPIYLGMALVAPAMAFLIDSRWALLVNFLIVILFKYLLIIPEEKYLLHKFSDNYEAYRKKVRRWL